MPHRPVVAVVTAGGLVKETIKTSRAYGILDL